MYNLMKMCKRTYLQNRNKGIRIKLMVTKGETEGGVWDRLGIWD